MTLLVRALNLAPAAAQNLVAGATFLGCFDSTVRKLRNWVWWGKTLNECLAKVSVYYQLFFAIQIRSDGPACFLSTDATAGDLLIPSPGTCNTTCALNSSQWCGSTTSYPLYRLDNPGTYVDHRCACTVRYGRLPMIY